MFTVMSVDYVVRLEHRRSSQPSIQLLGALARVLRLSDDKRHHLSTWPATARRLGGRLARAGLLRMHDLLG